MDLAVIKLFERYWEWHEDRQWAKVKASLKADHPILDWRGKPTYIPFGKLKHLLK